MICHSYVKLPEGTPLDGRFFFCGNWWKAHRTSFWVPSLETRRHDWRWAVMGGWPAPLKGFWCKHGNNIGGMTTSNQIGMCESSWKVWIQWFLIQFPCFFRHTQNGVRTNNETRRPSKVISLFSEAVWGWVLCMPWFVNGYSYVCWWSLCILQMCCWLLLWGQKSHPIARKMSRVMPWFPIDVP